MSKEKWIECECGYDIPMNYKSAVILPCYYRWSCMYCGKEYRTARTPYIEVDEMGKKIEE